MYYRRHQEHTGPITIRAAGPQDAEALRRLAQRDSRAVPDGELLIALVRGEARAAISLARGETIADPFHRTEGLVRMLALRRAQLARELRQPPRGLRRLLPSLASG
jgi:hypothetical protein